VKDIEPETTCAKVRENIERVLDGELGELHDELAAHLLECDECRDFRHDVERAAEAVRAAGADYEEPSDLLERVLARVDALESDSALPGVTRSAESPSATAAPVSLEPTTSAAPASGPRPSSDVPQAEAKDTDAPQADAKDTDAPQADAKDTDAPQADAKDTDAAGGVSEAALETRVPREGSLLTRFGAALRRSRARHWVAVGVAAAAVITLWMVDQRRPGDAGQRAEVADGEPWSGRVAELAQGFGSREGLSVCVADGAGGVKDCRSLEAGDEVPAGAVLRTDAVSEARLELVDGTEVVLDRRTELRLDGDRARRGGSRNVPPCGTDILSLHPVSRGIRGLFRFERFGFKIVPKP